MSESSTARPHILHICTSCRAPGSPRQPFYQREGYKLFQALQDGLRGSDLDAVVEVRAAECLSVCSRPCGIAISSPGLWSYLFGDQHPHTSVDEIIECLKTYISTNNGFMPRDKRPKGLRGGILGRIPPLEETNASV